MKKQDLKKQYKSEFEHAIKHFIYEFKELEYEKEIKSKQVFKQSFKAKDAFLNDEPNGWPFFMQAMLSGCPIEVRSQGKLQNNVQFVELKIYFKEEKVYS